MAGSLIPAALPRVCQFPMKLSLPLCAQGVVVLLALSACVIHDTEKSTSAAPASPMDASSITTNSIGQKIAPVLTPKTPSGTAMYNIRDFGATGDGLTIDSDAINRAIDAAAHNGGGTVYFPAGFYLCYSIRLKSGITLYLDQGSWIIADETPAAITALQPRGNGRGGPRGAAAGTASTSIVEPAPVTRGSGSATAVVDATSTGPNPADFPAPLPSGTVADFLAKVPPGSKMYDLPEKNMWTGIGAWRRPAQAGVVAAGSVTPTDPPPADQPPPAAQYQDSGHSFWQNSLIWGDGVTDVSILGPGIIYGRGLSRGDGASSLGGGNKSIALKNCRNVILKDFTIWQGGWFGLLATGVDNFTITNIKVDTNRDGFDIDACQNVHISDCTVNSPQDDGIVLKSSYALGYSRPCQNITITNCLVSGFETGSFLNGTYKPYTGRQDGGSTNTSQSGLGTGRIKFGTESNGGFKNITISNCVFTHCRGLALESVDGGNIEDININNISMHEIDNAPIYIRLGRRLRGPADTTTVGVIRRVNISNVVVSNAANKDGIIIAGTVDHPIEDVHLSDIRIMYQGKGLREWAQFDPPEDEMQGGMGGGGAGGGAAAAAGTDAGAAAGAAAPGGGGGPGGGQLRVTYYPEPGFLSTMPAYGLFVRHVNGLTLRNVEINYAEADFRPAVVLDDVSSITFDHFKAQLEAGVPEFMLWNTRDFSVERSPGIADQHIDKMDEGVVAK